MLTIWSTFWYNHVFIDLNCFLRWVMWPMGFLLKYQLRLLIFEHWGMHFILLKDMKMTCGYGTLIGVWMHINSTNPRRGQRKQTRYSVCINSCSPRGNFFLNNTYVICWITICFKCVILKEKTSDEILEDILSSKDRIPKVGRHMVGYPA